MRSIVLSAQTAGLAALASVAVLVTTIAVVPATSYGQSAGVSLESAGVREQLSHEVQQPGPVVVPEAASHGTSESPEPAGTIVPALSSEFSDTWTAPHKPLIARVFDAPVNFKAPGGQWKPINDALVASPLGGYENTANRFVLDIPDSLASGVSLSSQDGTVAFSLEGASTALPVVSADSASYTEVLQSTDLSYRSESAGVHEAATLKDTGAPTQLRYALSLSSGLTPELQADGSIAVVDAAGMVSFSIPAPIAFPKSTTSASGRVLPVALTASGTGWLITVDTGEAWLREILAHGSVVVDPTVNVAGSQACTITADNPKTGYCASKEVQAGYDATHKEHHALLKFNVTSIPKAAIIVHATLGLYVQAHSTSSGKPVGVYRVTKPWTTGATWETYDGTHAWSTAGGDYSNPEKESDASVVSSVGTATGWYHWYPTKMVQEWVNGSTAPKGEGYPNEGLIVKDEKDNVTQNLLTIASPTATSNTPYLEVAYEPRGQGSEPQYTTASTPLTDRSTMRVNVASGDLMIQANDLALSGVAGLGFSSVRTWNSLNLEQQEYGAWSDSNADENNLSHFADGTVAVENASGAWFTFIKQSNSSYITPPGIKAIMCERGSPAPCPETLPAATKFRLVYDASQTHTDFSEEGTGLDTEDRYKNAITRTFPSKEHMLFSDTRGHKIEELSNSETWITEIKDASGSRSTKYAYEKTEAGTVLKTFTDANGKSTTYGYEGHHLTSITDPAGNVTKFSYDGENRITEIIRTTNVGHTEGPTTKLTYYEGESVPAACGASPKATRVKDPDWKAEKAHETLYCSNVLDEIEKTVDAKGNATEAEYNPFGDLTTTTAAAPGTGEFGNVASYKYDETGVNLECAVTGASKPSASCPEIPNESSLVTSYSYKDKKNPFSSTKIENPQAHRTFACYNGGEQPEEEAHKCPTTAEGQPTGSLQNKTDALSTENELSFAYNANGTVSTSTDSGGHSTSYEYDASGNLKKITPPTGSTISATSITVDADGRPHVVTDGAGHIATITYDNLDRVTEIAYTGTGTAKTVKLEYDADGNISKRVDPTGTTKYAVDALNRVTKEELPGALSNSYEYDPGSHVTAFTDGGGTTNYKYDGLNHLEAMTNPGATKETQFVYDNDGRLIKVTYPSGAIESYKLEPATGRPETVTAEGTTGTTVPKLTYLYQAGKNQTSLIQKITDSSGNTTTYTYDNLDRLEKAVTEGTNPSLYEFKLDGAGNRTQQTVNPTAATGGTTTYYATNSGNELECRQTVSGKCTGSALTELSHYSYDTAGNETAITPKNDTSGATFEFNAASQLSSLTPSGGAATALAYGGTGQDDLISVGSTTTIQNSQLGLTREVNSAGTSYYVRTAGGMLVGQRTPSGYYTPLYDGQGNVIALVNSAANVERTFRYGPYGENTKSQGNQTIPYPFGYKAGYRAPGGNLGLGNVSNGLYHFGERYYDPTTGRWTQQDPISHRGSVTQGNRFLFVGANPTNRSDPSGREFFEESLEYIENAGEEAITEPLVFLACLPAKYFSGLCEEYTHPAEAE